MSLIAIAVALAGYVTWERRWYSADLFDEAATYYEAAERWQRDYLRTQGDVGALYALAKRDACLREAHKLARKALRRMDWRML